MMMKSNNILLFVILFLTVSSLFTSIEARRLKVQRHKHHHQVEVLKKGGETAQQQYEQILALRGIKNSGPSPGEGHSALNGAHN